MSTLFKFVVLQDWNVHRKRPLSFTGSERTHYSGEVENEQSTL